MKISVLKSVALIVLVAVGSLTVNVFAQNKFVFNDIMDGDLVLSTTVYKNSGTLSNHLKYDYKYDNEKRVTEKEAFKWNERKNEWTPYYIMNFTYTDVNIIMDYAKWNTKDKAYSLGKERTIYDINEFRMPVAFEKFKMNKNKGTWEMVENGKYTNMESLYTAAN